MRNSYTFQMLALLSILASGSAFVTPTPFRRLKPMTPRTTALSMGLLDSISSFLQDREGDFVKLEDSGSAIGPGPLLLLYNLPQTIQIDNDEYLDMVEDGAPEAFKSGVIITRISRNDDAVLDMSLSDALEQLVRDKGVVDDGAVAGEHKGNCLLLFSGFLNSEMMATYNIVGKEIYEESGGSITPACAKAVKNAMEKPLRQVLEEISGDHDEAMSSE